MLQYITLKGSLEELSITDSITFHIPKNSSYEYSIVKARPNGYHCYIENNLNQVIFDILELNAEKFVKNVVGYTCVGAWPEVKTLDDLKKVIKALDDECIKKWGIPNKNTPQFKVGDIVEILPRNDFPTNYHPTYTDGMLKYAGKFAIITNVSQYSCKINLDDSTYFWPFEALQLISLKMNETADPHNLKNGDYIKIIYNELFYIYIVNRVEDNAIYRHAAYYSDDGSINVNTDVRWFIDSTTKITYATEEERQLLDKALLEQGFIWNSLTKQLDSIGLINIRTNNLPDKYDMYIDTLDCTKEKPQTETELNLFPTKKHYQLNFNY